MSLKPKSIHIFVAETNINLYGWQIIIQGFFRSKYLLHYIPFTARSQTAYIQNDAGKSGIDVASWRAIGQSIMDDLESEKLGLKRLTDEHLMFGKRIWKIYKIIQRTDLSKAPLKQFIKWFKLVWADFMNLNGIGMVPVASDYYHNLLTKRLTVILEARKLFEEELHNALNLLMSPDRPSAGWFEQADLLNIVKRDKTFAKAIKSKDFERHLEKYKWLNYGYQGPRVPRVDFESRVKKLLTPKQPLVAQLREHKGYFKKLKTRQRSLERKLKLSLHERYLFGAARLFMYHKAYRVDVRHYFHFFSDQLFSELSRRFHLPLAWFRYAQREDILKLLLGKKVDKKLPFLRRKKLLLVLERGGKEYFVPQAKILAFDKKFIYKETAKKHMSLRGYAAFLGKVQGEAKIVHSIKDVEKVKHGDILVATTTNPDFLPAMYRSLAFVTDQGGITSHAAIVARELKKPCVIGTKFATKIFKDGDMVEVDANKGIVRKI